MFQITIVGEKLLSKSINHVYISYSLLVKRGVDISIEIKSKATHFCVSAQLIYVGIYVRCTCHDSNNE